MEIKFVEAGHSRSDPGNWGKFMVGRYTGDELAEPTLFPGCEGQRVVSLRGFGSSKMWVLDLATEEGFLVPTTTFRAAHVLEKHQVHVCPLFEPFLDWLLDQIRAKLAGWWDDLPRTVELPDAPGELYGYRRPSARPVISIGMPGDAVDWHWAGAPPIFFAGVQAEWKLIYHDREHFEKDTPSGWYLYGPDCPGLLMGGALPDAWRHASIQAREGHSALHS